ncbi:MAG: HD domain-containing phosphohydrolase [Bdellovibrionota bacterium]
MSQEAPSQPSSAPSLIVREKLHPIIVIDHDPVFIDAVFNDPQSKLAPPIIAGTPMEGQRVLSQFKETISGIFISLNFKEGEGITLAHLARRTHPEALIFFVLDPASPLQPLSALNPAILKAMGVQDILKKPIQYTELLKVTVPKASIFDPRDALQVASQNKDALDDTIQGADNDFFTTKAQEFLSGSVSYFDIYVRLSQSKYIKILRAGDIFNPDRVMTYINKGVTHFYLKREVQQHYLNYEDKVVSAILKSPSLAPSVKASQTLKFGEEALNYVQGTLDPSKMEFAKQFVGNVEQLIRSMELTKNSTVKSFIENLAAYNHGIGVTVIASILAKSLDFNFGKALSTVGVAALFHDIGLYAPTEAIREERFAEMSEEEKKIFSLHPTNGAIILKSLPGMNPVVIQAVEQHHERRDKTGFPKKIGGGGISQVAEIIGLSDEFYQLIRDHSKKPDINPLHECGRRGFWNLFSPHVTGAFKSAFFPETVEPKKQRKVS